MIRSITSRESPPTTIVRPGTNCVSSLPLPPSSTSSDPPAPAPLPRRRRLLLLHFSLAQLALVLPRLRALLHAGDVGRLGRLLDGLFARLHLVLRDPLLVAREVVRDCLVGMRRDPNHQPEQREEQQRGAERARERNVHCRQKRSRRLPLGLAVPRAQRELRGNLHV